MPAAAAAAAATAERVPVELVAEAEGGGGTGSLLAEAALARLASVFVTSVRWGSRGIGLSSRSGMARLRMVEFQRFLMALSVRPGSRCKFKEWRSRGRSDCAMPMQEVSDNLRVHG